MRHAPGDVARERHSPEWGAATRQSGDWCSRPTAGNRQTCQSLRSNQSRRKARDTKRKDMGHTRMDKRTDSKDREAAGLAWPCAGGFELNANRNPIASRVETQTGFS